jgi:hypothetical protein
MSKWAVLKNALLGLKNDAKDQKASIHRHTGFEMLNKRVSQWEPRPLVVFVSHDENQNYAKEVAV